MTTMSRDDGGVASRDDVIAAYAELAGRVEASDWSYDTAAALTALLTQPTSLVATRLDASTDSSFLVGRSGDVVLGFIMDADAPMSPSASCEISVDIGGVPVRGGPLVIHPGGRLLTPFFLPILAIAYSQVHVRGDDPELLRRHVSVVYGLLQAPARRWIATATHALPEGAFVRHGHFSYPPS